MSQGYERWQRQVRCLRKALESFQGGFGDNGGSNEGDLALFHYAKHCRWDLFLGRLESHPQDALWRKDGVSFPVLHCLLKPSVFYRAIMKLNMFPSITKPKLDRVPMECWEAAIKACPEATVVPLLDGEDMKSPLHYVASRVHDEVSLELFNILLDRYTPPPVRSIQSTLSVVSPQIPSEVIQEHVYSFLDNVVSVELSNGETVLHAMCSAHPPVKAEALDALLEKAPELAGRATDEKKNLYPVHCAAQHGCSPRHFRLLIKRCPESLEEKAGGTTTPLAFYVGRRRLRRNMRVLKILAETRPRVNLITDGDGEYPWMKCIDEKEVLYLKRLTFEQSQIPLSDEERASGNYADVDPETMEDLQLQFGRNVRQRT